MFDIYSELITTLNEPCLNQNIKIKQIESIRQFYVKNYNNIKGVSNGPLSSYLAKTKQFLQNAGKNMFLVYSQVPFCSIYNSFKTSIEKLYPDFHNFTVLFEIQNHRK